MIDTTAELFKGELGSIHDIEHKYSLKEIDEYRNIRITRKTKEAQEEEKRQKELERQRNRK